MSGGLDLSHVNILSLLFSDSLYTWLFLPDISGMKRHSNHGSSVCPIFKLPQKAHLPAAMLHPGVGTYRYMAPEVVRYEQYTVRETQVPSRKIEHPEISGGIQRTYTCI